MAVIGCGPAGAVTANLLGLADYTTIVLEAETEFHDETRAIHMDHEAARINPATQSEIPWRHWFKICSQWAQKWTS